MKRIRLTVFCLVLFAVAGCKQSVDMSALPDAGGDIARVFTDSSNAPPTIPGGGLAMSVPEGDFINSITVFAFYDRKPSEAGGVCIYYKFYPGTDALGEADLQNNVVRGGVHFPSAGVKIDRTGTLAVAACKNDAVLGFSVRKYKKKEFERKTFDPACGVMLQAFSWNYFVLLGKTGFGNWYNYLSSKTEEISSLFNAVWMPPPSKTQFDYAQRGYAPCYLNNLDSYYGCKDALQSFNSELRKKNVLVIGDLVLNHRDGIDWGFFVDPQWTPDFKSICKGDSAFKQPHLINVQKDAKGNERNMDSGLDDMRRGSLYEPFRNLDHSNKAVRDGIGSWMNSVLYRAGFNGWRFDCVKLFSPAAVKEYHRESCAEFSVAEYWPNVSGLGRANAAKEILEWQNAATDPVSSPLYVFDFVLKDMIQQCGSAATGQTGFGVLAEENALFRRAPKHQAVTFVDNHDTVRMDFTGPYSCAPCFLGAAYTFILMSPGFPCVFWNHFFETDNSVANTGGLNLKNHIEKLINMRRQFGIRYDAAEERVYAGEDAYIATIAGREKTVILKIGNGTNAPSEIFPKEYLEIAKVMEENLPVYVGKFFAVWVKDGIPETEYAKLELNPPKGDREVQYVTFPGDPKDRKKLFAYAWKKSECPRDYMSWPGLAMTRGPDSDQWTVMIPCDCNRIIINDGEGHQSSDITVPESRPEAGACMICNSPLDKQSGVPAACP